MTRWTRLPIRWRLTAAFAAAMALLIGGLSGFVYARTGADLLAAVDAGLSSRAELLVADVQEHGPGLAGVRPTLIESDEVFAQIATAAGRIIQSSPLIARPAAAAPRAGPPGARGRCGPSGQDPGDRQRGQDPGGAGAGASAGGSWSSPAPRCRTGRTS